MPYSVAIVKGRSDVLSVTILTAMEIPPYGIATTYAQLQERREKTKTDKIS